MFTQFHKRSLAISAFVLCLLLAQSVAFLPVAEEDTPVCPSANVAQFQLCRDFRDIRDLIPANTLVYIMSKHYQRDPNFRRAMEFMKTPQFDSISLQIAESDAYQRGLQRFADAGIDTAAIANISNIFNCLLMLEPTYSTEVPELAEIKMQDMIVPRTLQTFSNEMVNAIPGPAFNALISDKLSNRKEFASFYHIVRSDSFARQVDNALKSYQLAYPTEVLKRNYIDLRKLVKLVRKLLLKGPRVSYY